MTPSQKTTPLHSRPSELVFRAFELEVIDGPDKGSKCPSIGLELVVGTAPGNQLILTDPTISRHHFRVLVTPHGPLLRDLSSTNGTILGGIAIESAYLQPGAVIAAGRTTMIFRETGKEVREPLSPASDWAGLVGESMLMRRLFDVLARIAPTDASVLLEGETGTGKGLVAHAIHTSSARASGPFVVVDCGAIAPTLIESELFGHEKGSFTGATGLRVGAFEAADRGTVFLDEIGELPLELQPKLLRVLDDHTIKRVGGQKSISVNVRVVAASNRVLLEEVNRGAFRSDLFYRLNVVRIRIPALRDRAEDLPLLIAYFYRELTDGLEPPAELAARLSKHSWPGNVRELRAAVERAIVLGDETIPEAPSTRQDVHFDPAVPFRVAKERAIAAWEKEWIAELVRRHGGNLSEASRAAKTDRTYLRELLRKHRIATRDE